ncbi:MAG: dTDP-4-dehydrorhamnose 3,5-epimerase [Pseudanabaena sp. ELA607]
METIGRVEIRHLTAVHSDVAQFYTPQNSHETMLVQLAPQSEGELFVHHFQTDQLLVVRGACVLVVLQNRQYHYIPMTEHQPTVVTIPPNVPHAAINYSNTPCWMVNAVLRHGKSHNSDYRPRRRPFAFDHDQAQRVLQHWHHLDQGLEQLLIA